MSSTGTFFKQFYITGRAFALCGLVACSFLLTWLFDLPLLYPKILFGILVLMMVTDLVATFRVRKPVLATRLVADRLSNGDENSVTLIIKSLLPFASRLHIIEELPIILQVRKNWIDSNIGPYQKMSVTYQVRPVERGVYDFGKTIIFISSKLHLVQRRWVCDTQKSVKVYPSFLHLRKQKLLAQPYEQMEPGSRKIRRIGHSLEFEQVKEYVAGDDRRTINWRATARRNNLMVNHYMDEKSQQVYALIDKGRLMKMPFANLTLLDYAINAALALCSVCLHRQDRFGLITFSHQHGTVLAAERKPGQLGNVLEALYQQETLFLESDFERLYLQVRKHIRHRSLLMVFTNFESTTAMHRQLPYLKQLAKHHLVLVIIFENTELLELSNRQAESLEDIYNKTIAQKFIHDKRLMVKELQQNGLLAMLSAPANTSIDAINKYIEIKKRQAI